MATKSPARATNESPDVLTEMLDHLFEGSEADEPNVPIVDSSEVDALKAQLAEMAARATKAEATVSKTFGVQRGRAVPEIADPYVPGSETHAGLNETNAEDTMSLADARGRPEFKNSHITHRLGNRKTAGKGATFWLYDRQGMARRVPGQNLNSALAFGLMPTCPKCEGYHKESETNPNACPANVAKGKVDRTNCQICKNQSGSSIYIYDTQSSYMGAAQDAADDDTLQVMDLPSSPTARLKVKLEEHIRHWHPATAASMGLI